MEDASTKSQGTQPPPSHDHGHSYPRRTTPEKSITLMHHRLARDSSMKDAIAASALPKTTTRRTSSGESYNTGQSDPKSWFDRSNRNANATFDASAMDADPPFFQKETESSNEGNALTETHYPYMQSTLQVPLSRPTVVTHSSSADDYRSVIDDLTIENKRLKEELKRYKQFGPDLLRKEKLFEIKMHGLPKRKKRELEATLRNFAASLGGGSTDASSQQVPKPSRHTKNRRLSGDMAVKHESSLSSRSRPTDSAYASMSAGPSSTAALSSGVSLHQPPSLPRMQGSDPKAAEYLHEIPAGLYPKHTDLSDHEKKKVVVRRLEQLFTGTAIKRRQIDSLSPSSGGHEVTKANLQALPEAAGARPSREAMIQISDGAGGHPNSSSDSRSAPRSGGQADSQGNGASSARESGERSGDSAGHGSSPSTSDPQEQRPTRPFDLDPDRVQVGADNMNYIRHLGMVPPDLMVEKKLQNLNVSPDADGWVYINLLSNMAQLHMLNVTPDFIRHAVSEKSTKFQVSPDRRKIRWRGSKNVTKFSSDSSGETSQRSSLTDDTDGSNEDGQRKKFKSQSTGGKSAQSSKQASNTAKQASASWDSFHYKPLFIRQSSSDETSWEGSGSQASYAMAEESNPGNNSGWGISGSGSVNQRRKRKHDGAVIYYNGAPFCTDFSGDLEDLSPAAYMESTAREMQAEEAGLHRPHVGRSPSGSSLPFRPLADKMVTIPEKEDAQTKAGLPDLDSDSASGVSDVDAEFPWISDEERRDTSSNAHSAILGASGLGGVMPDDHFALYVTTRRPVVALVDSNRPGLARHSSNLSGKTTESIIGRLAQVSTKTPSPPRNQTSESFTPVEIDYLKGRFQRMRPAALPPPAMFFPPFSSDSDYSDGEDSGLDMVDDDGDGLQSEDPSSRIVNPHLSDNEYPDHADLSSNDEEDEVDARQGFDNFPALERADQVAVTQPLPNLSKRTDTGSTDLKNQRGSASGSSAATAGGGEESGYSSSMEDD